MIARSLLSALLLSASFALAACGQGGSQDKSQPGPQLVSPAPESEPTRVFTASNDATRAVTGAQLTVAMPLRMPDAAHAGESPTETLVLTGANGLVLNADLTSDMSPAQQVGGQTLRALLAIDVEEPKVIVYRVTGETKPEGGRGICGAGAPAYVVVFEPSIPGEPVLKALGVMGAAPGAPGSTPCPMLEYRRS